MPLSKEKEFSLQLYETLPENFINKDKEIKLPKPQPLKRFFEIAGKGLSEVEKVYDMQKLLYNVDKVNPNLLDILGAVLGFDFPDGTTIEEKRRFLKNLPNLYKLKGNQKVFELLARIIFDRTARTSTSWEYIDNEDGSTSRKVRILLEVDDSIFTDLDLESRRQRFNIQVQTFRPVNVGLIWTILVVYKNSAKISNKESDTAVSVDFRHTIGYGLTNSTLITGKMPIKEVHY